jgi:hypothetical protein
LPTLRTQLLIATLRAVGSLARVAEAATASRHCADAALAVMTTNEKAAAANRWRKSALVAERAMGTFLSTN